MRLPDGLRLIPQIFNLAGHLGEPFVADAERLEWLGRSSTSNFVIKAYKLFWRSFTRWFNLLYSMMHQICSVCLNGWLYFLGVTTLILNVQGGLPPRRKLKV